MATEESTYVVTISFTDEDGDPVVPTAIAWTLTDNEGTVVNGRSAVSVAVPAASVEIVLQGADLVVADPAESVERRMIVRATYNSSLGIGLPLNDSCLFLVRGL
jgi:hypothetical protein